MKQRALAWSVVVAGLLGGAPTPVPGVHPGEAWRAWNLPACAAGDEERLEGAALESAISGWIRDLSHPTYVRREAARHRLTQYIDVARRRLEALRESADAEVRRTVDVLLASRPGAAAGEAAQPVTAGIDAARIGAFDDDPGATGPAVRMAHLLGSVGGHAVWPGEPPTTAAVPESGPGSAGPVPTPGSSPPFFTLVDHVAAQGGAVVPEAFDSLGALRLTQAEEIAHPAPQADAGLFRVRVVEVTRTRALGSADATARTTLGLHVAWPPALEIRELRAPRVISARDRAGQAWSAAARGGFSMMGLSSGSTSARVPLVLESDTDAGGDALAALEIELPMLARHGRRDVLADAALALPRHLDAEGRDVSAGAAVLSLLSLVSEPAGSGNWIVEAIARLPEGRSATAGLVLVTEDGRTLRMHVSAGRVVSADGTVHLTGRAWRAGEGQPRALGLSWFEQEEAVTLRVRLLDVPLR